MKDLSQAVLKSCSIRTKRPAQPGKAANELGVWLACHAQAAEAVKMAVRSGFRSIYHCTYADEEALDLLESKKEYVFVAPAPGLLFARLHEAEEFGIRPHDRGADGRSFRA